MEAQNYAAAARASVVACRRWRAAVADDQHHWLRTWRCVCLHAATNIVRACGHVGPCSVKYRWGWDDRISRLFRIAHRLICRLLRIRLRVVVPRWPWWLRNAGTTRGRACSLTWGTPVRMSYKYGLEVLMSASDRLPKSQFGAYSNAAACGSREVGPKWAACHHLVM